MKFQRSHPSSFLLLMLLKLQDRRNQQGGYTLVITIAVLLILSVLLLTFAITSKVDNASSSASAKGNTGFYAAEAGLNLRAKSVRDRFEGYNRPSGTSPASWRDCLSPSGNKGTGDFQCQTNTNLSPQPVTTYVEDETGAVPETIVIPAGEVNEGLTAQEYRYNVVSVAQDNQGKPSAIVGLTFKSRLIPLFQFAAFYDQDMDISLPPNMTLTGPVHTNNDLYLNASIGNTLGLKGQVTTANKLYRGRKDINLCTGTVQIDDPTPTTLNFGAANCSSGRTEFTQSAVAPWNGRIRVGIPPLKPPPPSDFDATPGKLYWDSADLRLVLDLTSPSTPALQIRSAGDAPLTPETNTLLNSSTCAPTQTQATAATTNAVTVTLGTGGSFAPNDLLTVGNDPHLYFVQSVAGDVITIKNTFKTPVPVGAIVRKPIVSFSDKTFRNYREKRGLNGSGRLDYTPIQMMNVDVRGVLGCAETLMGRSLDEDTDGGLLWFVTVKGTNSNTINDYGIRLYNGQDLVTPIGGKTPRGLSIVSDQAIYVRGNYNCGTACTNSTFALPANVSQRKPAAIMADSINLLSNAWPLDDSWSSNLISTNFSPPVPNRGRPATETTYNAAFLAGIDITGGVNRGGQDKNDATGGGLNNYPRLHEDWRTWNNSEIQNLNYLGSLVSLAAPLKVNGKFCGSGSTADCNIYNPPQRDWRYDTQFNNAANLPPLTPRVVSLKQELFSRNFDQAALPFRPFWSFLAPQHVWGRLGSLIQAKP